MLWTLGIDFNLFPDHYVAILVLLIDSSLYDVVIGLLSRTRNPA